MTIIDFLRQKLTEYPKISEFMAGADIHIDFTDPDPTNYGLSSTGDSLIREDVLGNQIRQHNFVMYAVAQSFTGWRTATFCLSWPTGWSDCRKRTVSALRSIIKR